MPASASLVRYVGHALTYLYDPYVLRSHPLIMLFKFSFQPDAHTKLRDSLIANIEGLKPSSNVPLDSRAWRVYKILNLRYIQQLEQDQVAYQLGISVRHLRREQRASVQILADTLAQKYGVEESASPLLAEPIQADEDNPLTEELLWLKDSTQEAIAAVSECLEFAFQLVAPLAKNVNVHLELRTVTNLPPVVINPTALRQALVSMATCAINRVPDGQVQFSAQKEPQRIALKITALGQESLRPMTPESTASLNAARALVGMYDDYLKVDEESSNYALTLSLPIADVIKVCVIDDNADICQLLERFAVGTRFHVTGIQSTEYLFERIAEQQPDLLLLDVMMPIIDGWQILGQLRQHPQTCTLPIIICSVLPERDLALALGATAYLPKPVSRPALLDVLNQVMGEK